MLPTPPSRARSTVLNACNARAIGIAVLATVIACSFFTTTPEPTDLATIVDRTANDNGHDENTNRANFDLAPVIQEASPSQLERRDMDGVDVLLERPADPKGIIFVGHGCHHSNTDFWPSTPNICPECIGLPEERAIVDMALNEFELMVVATSSGNRESKCWSASDGPIVAKILTTLEKEVLAAAPSDHPDAFPILGFGASSGGGFVGRKLIRSMNATGRPLDGFIAQIASAECRKELPKEKGDHPFPVATYITMDRDEGSDELVGIIVDYLQKKDYPAKHIRLPPLPITDSFFHDRIPSYSLDQSKILVGALRQANYLDENDLLIWDPRRSQWRDILREHVACPPDCLKADESPISEVLNTAWGMHEMARDGVREAIAFILKEHSHQAFPSR